MTYVQVNNTLYPAKIEGEVYDRKWDNRESKSITLGMSYTEALDIFKDNTKWFIVNQPESYTDNEGDIVVPEPIEYDNSQYSLAGPVTDNRDGTVTVKMGKPTEVEALQSQLENSVTSMELEVAYREGVNSL